MENDKSLVSIVTPSYNQGTFIEDTLLSVMNQDYPNIEHLVIDGGSSDNTIEILKKWEDKYNLRWLSEPDEGQSDAVNKGFKLAKGEIVGWLNSDDVYFDTKVISQVVGKFEELKHVDVIYGNLAVIDKNGSILKLCRTFNWDYKRLLRICFFGQPATFFRRRVVLENQLDKNLHLAMDYEFWLRLGESYNFARVDKVLAGFRVYEGTKSFSNKNKDKYRLETKRIMTKYGQDFGLGYYIWCFFHKLLLGYMRLKSVKDILELTNTEDLAFNAKIPSKLTRIKTQISLKDAWKLVKPGL
jgi:glycosyltransferase involved in cell wall biosynthesis